jgi:hypothetical protein
MLIFAAFLAPAALSLAALAEPVEKPAATLLPASTVAYVEITRPKDVIQLVLDHPLRRRIEQAPQFKKALQSEQFKQLLAAVDLFEKRSSLKWRPALEQITGGGVVVAVDPATQGLVILARPDDRKTTDAAREALFAMARDDAAAKGNPDPIENKDYRGLTAWKLGEAYVANVGPWLLISNNASAAKGVADQFLDGGSSLADEKEFAQARSLAMEEGHDQSGDTGHAAWGYVRLAPLRLLGVARQLIDNNDKSDNPAAELLFGGILSELHNSPFVTATLDWDRQGGLNLSLATPQDAGWVPAARKYYFAPADGGADAPLMPKGTLLSVSTYRDLSAFWQAAPDLFNEGVAGKIAQSDSSLSTFLGGKSFGTDIIGALRPEIQIVAASQDYQGQSVREPSIRLPAFAAVLRIKPGQAKTVRKAFHLAFQSLIALTNLDAASKNRPPLETSSETRGGAEVLYAAYDADDTDKPAAKSGDKPAAKEDTYLNFSPSLVLSNEYLVLASTRHIAEDLADLIGGNQGKPAADLRDTHTLLTADGAPVAQILRADREQLIAQNMLEKGHDRAQAEREVDWLISIVESVTNARICLARNDRALRLDIGVKSDAAR